MKIEVDLHKEGIDKKRLETFMADEKPWIVADWTWTHRPDRKAYQTLTLYREIPIPEPPKERP